MERAQKVKKIRFDTELTKVQKELFELATKLGGYHTVTDFILSTAEERAKIIVQQHEAVLISARDKKLFFDAVMNPPQPNQRLLDAAKRYKEFNNRFSKA